MDQITQILELMDRSAFCVSGGRIVAVNAAAKARQFETGIPIGELLTSGKEEYAEFSAGCLCLTLCCCGEHYTATVTALGDKQVFTLDASDSDGELRLLGLAAQELREPLSNALSLVEELCADSDARAKLNRSLYQLLRLAGNMSDHPAPRMELLDIQALLWELWEKARDACDSRGVAFTFQSCGQNVYTCADEDLLIRAIHNLLSNALKYTEKGGKIQLSLSVRGRSYRITMHSSGAPAGPLHNPFARFRREPGLEDGRNGLGLGLRIVQNAALSHGGAVLLDEPPEGGVRVTLSLPIRQNTTGLRSSRYRISYSGDRDPMLIELSDVLPPEFYRN